MLEIHREKKKSLSKKNQSVSNKYVKNDKMGT